MAGNTNLRNANKAKQDEFYTQLADIELEMKHYKNHFKDKIIFCNCDDPYESNFFKYFALNFNYLGIKKLVATCYYDSPIANTQLSLFDFEDENDKTTKAPHKIEITEVEDYNKDGAVDTLDVEYLLRNKKNALTRLKGDGDFRSEECIELLKESDIVVTNPPFSLFREFVAQLIKYNKQFLIIGNINAISYREIFPLLRDNKMWLGVSIKSGDRKFEVPDSVFDEEKVKGKLEVGEDGKKYVRVVGVRWFTNLDYSSRHENIILYKNYSPEEYTKYDNYDAINVDLCVNIPLDYDGHIGVPISFMDKYNPEQFRIVGLGISSSGIEMGVKPYKPEHKKYRKEVQGKGAVDGDLYMLDKEKNPMVPYARIIIEKI